MAIKSLYRDYFQKSRIFLYPALEIKRGVSVTPIQTFVAWKGRYEVKDRKLMTMYYLRDDQDFKTFEKQKLLGNKLFHEFFEVDDDRGIYVFDFSERRHDWDCFVSGRYSRMTSEHKKRIKSFFGNSDTHYAYIESYLSPEKYMHMYANVLTTTNKDVPGMLKILKGVGELCSVPDMEQETLDIQIKNLDLKMKKS